MLTRLAALAAVFGTCDSASILFQTAAAASDAKTALLAPIALGLAGVGISRRGR